MAEKRVRVCDWLDDTHAHPGVPCRKLGDSVCTICAGDFCTEHLTSQNLSVTIEADKLVPPKNPSDRRKFKSHPLASRRIDLCPACYRLLEQSYEEGRGTNGAARSLVETIEAIDLVAHQSLIEAIRAYWTQRALSKSTQGPTGPQG